MTGDICALWLHRALKSCKLVQECTTPLERLALLTAAVGHDAGHDGVNNAFHVQAYSELSHLYLPTYECVYN